MLKEKITPILCLIVFVILIIPIAHIVFAKVNPQISQWVPPMPLLDYCDYPVFIANGTNAAISGKNIAYSFNIPTYRQEVRVYDFNQQRNIPLNFTPLSVRDSVTDIVLERYIAVRREYSGSNISFSLIDLGNDTTAGTADDAYYELWNSISYMSIGSGITNSLYYWYNGTDVYWCGLPDECILQQINHASIPLPGANRYTTMVLGSSSNPIILWEEDANNYRHIYIMDQSGYRQLFPDQNQTNQRLKDLGLNDTALLLSIYSSPTGSLLYILNVSTNNYSNHIQLNFSTPILDLNPMGSISQRDIPIVAASQRIPGGSYKVKLISLNNRIPVTWEPIIGTNEIFPSVDNNRIVFQSEMGSPYIVNIYTTQCYFGA